MLPDHQLHLLVVLPDGAHFARQDGRSLLRTQLLKLGILEEVSQGVLYAALFFRTQIILNLDTVLGELDNFSLLTYLSRALGKVE